MLLSVRDNGLYLKIREQRYCAQLLPGGPINLQRSPCKPPVERFHLRQLLLCNHSALLQSCHNPLQDLFHALLRRPNCAAPCFCRMLIKGQWQLKRRRVHLKRSRVRLNWSRVQLKRKEEQLRKEKEQKREQAGARPASNNLSAPLSPTHKKWSRPLEAGTTKLAIKNYLPK